MMIKRILKWFLPESFLRLYHYLLARMAQFYYANPSNKLIVIGVTGTNGKSSTVNFIAQILEGLGKKVGYTTTAGFMIAGEEIENKMKMTMPGRFYLQSLIRKMVVKGCDYAIIETSSQGLDQYRHLGVNYDVAVFTNLTPEHIEAHGGFENYKKAKGKLFTHTFSGMRKKIEGREIDKLSILNAKSDYIDYYANLSDKVNWFLIGDALGRENEIVWQDYDFNEKGGFGKMRGIEVEIPLIGKFQHENALAAIATVEGLGFELRDILEVVKKLRPVSGRLELINFGQPFSVIVDYAYEPYALKALIEVTKQIKHDRIIGVHGSAGGGRDIARRCLIGKLASEEEDLIIVTNEDPYDEDPRKIIEEVAEGAKKNGAIEGENLYLIDDRKEAIKFALESARENDIVLITGKGSEPVMAVAGDKKIPWSDIEVVKEILNNLGYEEAKN